jgi:hypothetical protein
MKLRVRITDEEAAFLGVETNQKEPGRTTTRARLTQEQIDQLNEFRHSGLKKHANERGINFNSVIEYWDKTKEYSVRVRPEVVQMESIGEELIKQMREYAPSYPKITREKVSDPHLLVVDPADVHIGKLARSFETGEDYDSEIAVQRVREGVKGIIDKSYGFNIDKILLVIGNDILHIDTPKRTTTSGTPQDTDGMWYENFLKAKSIYVEVIETLLNIADVHVTFNPSNHDYTNGFFLADVIKTWFKNLPNVSFDTSIAHRKYFMYGNNLIGTTHGDGAKLADLGSLMSIEARDHWSEATHRYIYTHHFHHKIAKDYINVTVESLRSPSAADSWHHRNGYQHAPKAIEGFIHHPQYGQIARLTHIF